MKILVLTNYELGLYNFRKEVMKAFVDEGHDVYISVPLSTHAKDIEKMGCHMIDTKVDRRGINPVTDIKLLAYYIKLIKKLKPDVILSYTIKPNIYGSLAASLCKVQNIVNITGLGSAIVNPGMLQKFLILMYRVAFKNVNCLFFQNKYNEMFFEQRKIASGKHRIIPGSGVNLKQYTVLEYPEHNVIEFVFVSRIMKEKGIDEYFAAAEYIKSKYPQTRFHICGGCEEEYSEKLKELNDKEIIIYHGSVANVCEIYKKANCIIHPSYHEGMSNVLLEAAACGRPGLCSDIPGCNEIIDDGDSGFLFKPKSAESMIAAIEKFLALSHDEKRRMGLNARAKVERVFDRNIVVNAYIEEINKIAEAKK